MHFLSMECWTWYYYLTFRSVFRTQSNIYDGASCENSQIVLTVIYLLEKPHRRCWTVLIKPPTLLQYFYRPLPEHFGILCIERLIKGALSGLRQFFSIKGPLKMMKNDKNFYFTSKARFVLKIFKFLSDFLIM